MANFWYNEFKANLMKPFVAGLVETPVDLTNTATGAGTGRVRVSLLRSTYTEDPDDIWTEIMAHEISEIGTGYDQFGELLGSPSVSLAANSAEFDGSDVTWTNATFTGLQAARYALLWYQVDIGGGNFTGMAIALIDFGSALEVNNADFTIEWNAAGILLLVHSTTGGGDTFVYNIARLGFFTGKYDFREGGDSLRVVLTTSSHSPDVANHDHYLDVTNELSTGSGYTGGGEELTGRDVGVSGTAAILTAGNTDWTSATFTCRRATVYNVTVADELICTMTFNENKSVVGGLFRLMHSSSGIVNIGNV